VKTVRFASVVDKAGHPEPYTLWTDPKEDPHFQAALKAIRVLTVHQENVGAKADYGEVGFKKGGSLLLFPKSLKRFEGARIIGIKYDLLEPEKTPPRKEAARRPPKKRTAPPQGKEEPKPKHFPPLKLFQPAEKKIAARKAESTSRSKSRVKSRKEATAPEAKHLRAEIGKALRKLERGSQIAAYQILERALRA
jgi:hypothetical protein